MVLLQKISDPVMVQVLCDALAARSIEYRVENAGMNALMPLPGIMDVRILVEEREYDAAVRVLDDLQQLQAADSEQSEPREDN